jgi:hypothetical protein
VKVFISYSAADVHLVDWIAAALESQGNEVYWWQGSQVPGEPAWPMIFDWIDQSDLVLAVLTDKAVARAMAIGQEIGHARAKGKTVIPLVATNVDEKDLGCLHGVTYLRIDRRSLGAAIARVQDVICAMERRAAETRNLLLMAGGIIALIWAASQE